MHLTISEVSKTLGISKDTLRYYDKLELVCPKRNDNRYRTYSDSELLDLQYIEVMKYVGFSLKDIKQILMNMHQCTGQDLEDTKALLTIHANQIKKSIEINKNILNLLFTAQDLMNKKESPLHSLEIQKSVQSVFEDLRGQK